MTQPRCEVIGDCTLWLGKAETVLPMLDSGSVNLLVIDPPYHGVKLTYAGERIEWDRQWKTREAYLAWLRTLCKEWQRLLTPNGCLYCFASPQMAGWVEVTLSETFDVLNHLVWRKHDGSGAGTGGHSQVSRESLMSFFPQTERILFAAQASSDAHAQDISGYRTAEYGLKKSLFSAPIAEAMQALQVSAKEVTEAIGAYGKVNHGGAVSNWLQGYNIPTKAQYLAMRAYFNRTSSTEYLRQEYEDLRQEYQDLRQEYQDLRRPFAALTGPYTDVWDFATVAATPGKHPCEKPVSLLRHIIMTSSRPGDTILDCFAGSGSTLEAAKQCGRRGIGIEQDARWVHAIQLRLAQELLFPTVPQEALCPRVS